MKPNSIETVTGRFIDLLNPDRNDICTEDIAWALSRMPRYAGHTLTPLAYTVGQHSVVVMGLVQRLALPAENELRQSFLAYAHRTDESVDIKPEDITNEVLMETLIHDASEAYLLDVPTPLKNLPGMKEAYYEIESRMMSAIRQKYQLPEPNDFTTLLVKWADAYALTVEAYHLMKSRGSGWGKILLDVDLAALQNFESPKPANEVYRDFSSMVEEIMHARGLGW